MDGNNDITCENCGGTDFTTEGGFYYCTECQTQSQEIRERVFVHADNVPVIEKRIAIKKPESESNKNYFTSWEIFNYILYGLVGELEGLGADKEFIRVTYQLWVKYLAKLECISENEPKLGAVFKKRDAEIVFQRKFKRKRSKSLSNVSLSDMDDKMKYAERNKQRKLMEKAEYSSISQTLKSETTSLANQTLSGLSSEDESSKQGHISFSKRSKRELLRHMTKEHLQEHMEDINNELTCHKLNHRKLSPNYTTGPEVLTKNKLYCLIYLGLLLTQQNIQLGDLLRFCREGHLSFLDYKHFFPDHIENLVDHSVYTQGVKELPTSSFMRKFTYQLFKFLDLNPCDMSPKMVGLCRRYCTELNLPDQIFNIAGDYINNTRPFLLHFQQNYLPNYEGRAMGFIIYVLKVLLSLDDVTEHELSKFARLVNEKTGENKLFNFDVWCDYIEYRKIVLKYIHFPTWHLLNPNKDCPLDLYVKFFYNLKKKYELDDQSDFAISSAKKILTDIELLQDSEDDLIEFNPSLTPFKCYIEHLKSIPNFKVLDQNLNYDLIKDNCNQTVEYLIEPNKYLKQIKSKKCVKIFSNAHPKHKFQRIHGLQGDLFQNFEYWEEKYHKNFAEQKAEHLAFNKLVDDILHRHVYNLEVEEPVVESRPELTPSKDKRVLNIKKSVGRDSKGKFCKKTDPKALPPEKIKPLKKSEWHVSSWNETTLKNNYKPKLLDQVKSQIISEEKQKKLDRLKNAESEKYLNEGSKYKYHYIPRMEYWLNLKNVSYLSKEKYKEFENTLPKNFRWLLTECARILEQSTKDVYEEFMNVEIYMNYIYFKRMPVVSEPISNHKTIIKMMKQVESIW